MINTARLKKPIAIQFPINNICNSRCKMCHIWEQKKGNEITAEEVKKILRNPLFSDIKDVGINGGEPTLRTDLGEIIEAIARALPKIGNIYLISNALRSDDVCKSIHLLSGICHDNGIKLDVMISLDGLNQIHDTVRGRSGNFESAVRVLDFLQSSDYADSYRVGCTVIRDNVFGIESLLDWCINRDLHIYYRLGIPHRRLYNINMQEPFNLTPQEKFHFANFLDYLRLNYEQENSKRLFYNSLRNQLMYNTNRSVSCLWQSAGITLNSCGDIAYCAVESKTLGNALTANPGKIYWKNREHLSYIIKNKCSSCLHDYSPAPQPSVPFFRFRRLINRHLPDKVHKTVSSLKKLKKSNVIDINITDAPQINLTDMKRILICGWYGTETLGDKAILGGLIHTIRNCGDWAIDLASLEPYVSQNTKRQMPELNLDNILNLSQARSAIKNKYYSSTIMGGGPLMGPIRECRDILDLFTDAKNAGTTTIIGGCGIGPLGWPEIDPVIKQIIEISDHIIFRDSRSHHIVQTELRIKKECQVILDPAFVWADSQYSNNIEEKNTKQILLALRDWPIDEYGAHFDKKTASIIKDQFENELKLMVNYLLSKEPDLKIIPFCMHKYARGGDDRFFYRRIFSDYPEVLNNLDDHHNDPADDYKLFLTSHSILAMRFHSLVFGIASRNPVFAIDYTFGGKIAGLLEDLNASHLLTKLDSFSGKDTANLLLSPPKRLDIDDRINLAKLDLTESFKKALNETIQ